MCHELDIDQQDIPTIWAVLVDAEGKDWIDSEGSLKPLEKSLQKTAENKEVSIEKPPNRRATQGELSVVFRG